MSHIPRSISFTVLVERVVWAGEEGVSCCLVRVIGQMSSGKSGKPCLEVKLWSKHSQERVMTKSIHVLYIVSTFRRSEKPRLRPSHDDEDNECTNPPWQCWFPSIPKRQLTSNPHTHTHTHTSQDFLVFCSIWIAILKFWFWLVPAVETDSTTVNQKHTGLHRISQALMLKL